MSSELSPIVSGSCCLHHESYDIDVPTSHIGSGDRAGVQMAVETEQVSKT
jgi:hypothetical protein